MRQADAAIRNGISDPYFLSLIAASLYNLNRTNEARKYSDEVVNF